jgi:hypothetical protein
MEMIGNSLGFFAGIKGSKSVAERGTECRRPLGSRMISCVFPREDVERASGKVRPKSGWIGSMMVIWRGNPSSCVASCLVRFIEDFTPIEKAFVAGDDQAGTFVAAGTPLNKMRGWMKLTNNAFKSPIHTTPSPDKT